MYDRYKQKADKKNNNMNRMYNIEIPVYVDLSNVPDPTQTAHSY